MSKVSKEKVLGAIVILQGLLICAQFTGGTTHAARADLNLPNPSERQLEIIDELKQVNTKLDHLISTLQSGEVKVEIKAAKADDGK
jgi:hypothetical protein